VVHVTQVVVHVDIIVVHVNRVVVHVNRVEVYQNRRTMSSAWVVHDRQDMSCFCSAATQPWCGVLLLGGAVACSGIASSW
jgi:hypothetical protein